ncbi:uncharacterized protein LOC101159687 isoform X3 [Oryzias latipes]
MTFDLMYASLCMCLCVCACMCLCVCVCVCVCVAHLPLGPQVRELQEPRAAAADPGTPEDPPVFPPAACSFHRRNTLTSRVHQVTSCSAFCSAVEEIKNKFKNLRTTFQRQHKLVRASRQGGVDEAFVPQWKHYQQLLFLQGCWDQDAAADQPEDGLLTSGLVVSYLPTSSAFTSSGIPSNIMVKCFWTEERERTLILFYSEHSCLWNKKTENHNNRQLRQQLLESLRNTLSDCSVSFSVEDIKCKFKNLRTVFNREYKAVQASKSSDKHYVSKWKHYQQLLFLCESCEEDDPPDDVQVLMARESKAAEPGQRTPTSGLKPNNDCVLSSGARDSSPELFLAAEEVKASPQAASPSSCQSDRNAPADPRCLWSEAKTQQLISFYSEHSCLWNHKSANYKNRLLRQSLLETLSRLLSEDQPVAFTVEDIKTKFRNLRTVFQREHKVVSSNKTCGSEDFYLPKWKHYHQLMFLCESCDEEEPPGDLHALEAPQSRLLHLHGHGPAPPPSPQYHADTGLQAPPSPTPPDSRLSSPSSSSSLSLSSSYADSRLSARKRARRPESGGASELLDLMRTVCQNQTTSPHAGFLKYVEECLNETPPEKVKKLKKKIVDLIHSVVEDG